ncbi:hypothetical protein [Erwinia sp. SLM-02]|uniref:hypothetical protein n=1 Tax=Erwinia sp. SLM-02 TaxID=3020057 RepID=UPI003080D62C
MKNSIDVNFAGGGKIQVGEDDLILTGQLITWYCNPRFGWSLYCLYGSERCRLVSPTALTFLSCLYGSEQAQP